MKWVLIWVAAHSYGVATDKAYFETYDGCKAAKLQMETLERVLEANRSIDVRGFCTPIALDLGPEGGKVR